MKKFLTMILVLCSFSSMADYVQCDINNGSVGYCGSWAQAQKYPVLQSDGNYHECDINNGSVGYCGGWYQGSTIINK